jgi:dTDP-4-amino-4,6-dideoxygalactose transaminase
MVHKRAALLQYFGELVVPGREREEQQYNAYGLGWMYRGDMFSQAFIRSQLKRLDENNALRVKNCNFLTEHLNKIKGLETPFVPKECYHAYYNYVVGFKPEELGLDISPRTLREKVQEALRAEGVPTGQWQRLPVPAQEIFQNRVG